MNSDPAGLMAVLWRQETLFVVLPLVLLIFGAFVLAAFVRYWGDQRAFGAQSTFGRKNIIQVVIWGAAVAILTPLLIALIAWLYVGHPEWRFDDSTASSIATLVIALVVVFGGVSWRSRAMKNTIDYFKRTGRY